MNTPLPVALAPTYGSCAQTNGSLEKSLAQNRKKATRLSASGYSNESSQMEAQKSLLQRAANTIPCLGIILALCASVFLGSAGMLVKMTTSVHGIQVAVFRAIIQLVVYGVVIGLRGLSFFPKQGEIAPVMGRALLGATSITFSYYALKLIPLGDATTIRFSLPIWTLIVSYLVLNESCNVFKIGAVVLAISGVVLIAKPEDCVYWMHFMLHTLRFESDNQFGKNYAYFESHKQRISDPNAEPHQQLLGSLLALSSSICLSLSIIALRLCKRTPAEITILWLSIISIVIGSGALLALNEWRMPNNWMDVVYILLNGLCGSIGQWFITSALKIEQSGVISLARTFDIEVAFLYSAFVLHEHIRITSIIGSVLVSCGVIAVVVPKWLGTCEEANDADEEEEEEEEERAEDDPGRNVGGRAVGQLENGHSSRQIGVVPQQELAGGKKSLWPGIKQPNNGTQ